MENYGLYNKLYSNINSKMLFSGNGYVSWSGRLRSNSYFSMEIWRMYISTLIDGLVWFILGEWFGIVWTRKVLSSKIFGGGGQGVTIFFG